MRFGVEYTFLSTDNRRINAMANRLVALGFTRAHVDCDHVIEVPSPPHRGLKEAKAFFDRLGNAAGLENIVPRIIRVNKEGVETYLGTGGGHVHVEMPDGKIAKTKIMEQLLPFICNRPWIHWVFNEFMDDQNANSPLLRSDVRTYLRDGTYTGCYGETPDKHQILRNILCNKDFSVRFKQETGTMEFRVFDAPRSWQQSKDHIEFALAVMKHMKKRADRKAKPEKVSERFTKDREYGGWWWSLEEADEIFRKEYKTLKDVRVPFKKLCKTLGLSWRRYSKYVQNYEDRLAFGELT